MNNKEKIAVITGSNGSIGRVLVKALMAIDFKCICIDKEIGPGSNCYSCDFTNPEQIDELTDVILKKLDHIDVLVNVAGIGIYKNIEALSIKEWVDSLTINLTAPFILSKKLLPILQKSDGLIINFGSGMGIIPTKNRISYCASKFGLRGLTLSLSEEFQSRNVSFVLLTLGSVMTNFGSGGIEARKRLERDGKKYLSVDEVVNKVIEIIESPVRLPEYLFYPPGYLSDNQS